MAVDAIPPMIHAIKELYNALEQAIDVFYDIAILNNPALARGVRVYEIREAMEKWRTYKIV